jgi:serine/threonine protein phosphatase PrpC
MLRAAETVWKTDTGRQRRDNEDNAFARAPVFVVADGMGGAQAGEVASKIAIEAFEQGLPDSGSPEQRLADRVREANRRIHERSRADHERAGMGTTLTAAYLDDAAVAIAHVGDSRAYLFRDGSLERLTEDHSLVEELVRQQKLTPEQAAEHPQRSIITRALGPEETVEVDTWTYPVRAGDVLLLCSDGLTSMVSEARVAEILAASDSLTPAADALIDAANGAGGRDNITVVLFRLEEVGGDGAKTDDATMVGVHEPVGAARNTSGASPASSAPSSRAGSTVAEQTAVHRVPAAVQTAPRVRRLKPIPAGEMRDRAQAREPRRRSMPRYAKVLVALFSLLVVLALIGAGGYLATRQLYFIGTDEQGIVTVYRGLPYDLPGGIRLYETFYTSGVPGSLVPSSRQGDLLNNHLRSQSDATSVVMALEQGRISK